ncbi:hypothetical protein LEP1GSC073_0554 [Leptospira noguchii str. Cascata]|nr:hypothetical protein LEP1GSC073_0554 [Leptospira noguchii str. Cascata]
MNVALQIPNLEPPKQSDKTVSTWSEICISLRTNPNRIGNKLFPIVPETQSKKTKMKIASDLSLSSTTYTFTPSAHTKSSSKLPSRPQPLTSEQLKEKRKNPAINIDFFTNLTKKLLFDFYPKYCPNCPDTLLTKEISTQPELIRCEKCRYLTSRLSYTPLHHMKLPIWNFSYVLYESMIQFPKVLTSTEISKRLKISYKGAASLKKKFQVFASQQLPKYKQLTYDALNKEFKDFSLPPDEDTDITEIMENHSYVCADTVVLYSASQRANHGRKRYRHGGTASIYLSAKLGGTFGPHHSYQRWSSILSFSSKSEDEHSWTHHQRSSSFTNSCVYRFGLSIFVEHLQEPSANKS